mmetsp:Transcript_14430/g.27739  ORF Transcript_14430/g.27739 Transcript_14430/m.27739 type:complete len:580 (+) Transcript_14430:1-1740(+)
MEKKQSYTTTMTATAPSPSPAKRRQPRSRQQRHRHCHRQPPRILLLLFVFSLLLSTHAQQSQSNPAEFNGGSILAMAGRNSIAIATDSRFGLGFQTVSANTNTAASPTKRLFLPPDTHSTMVAWTGLLGDGTTFSEELSALLANKARRAGGMAFPNDRDDDDDDDATYKLTSKTGSRRYMSPEVALCRTYNRKADVYSFGMLIYEIATLIQPFEGYTMHRHEAEVLRRGRRPCLAGYAPSSPSSSTSSLLAPLAASKLVSSLSGSNNSAGVNDYWPRDLKSLIEDCWHSDMRARPRMKDVVRRLEDCIRELTPSDTSSKLEKASSSTCQSMVAKTDESPAKDGTRVETTARSLLSGSFRGRKATKLQQYPSKKSEPFGDDSKVASSPSSSSSSSYSSSGKGEAAAPAADSVEHRKGRTHSPATTSNAIDGKSRKKLEQFIATAAFAIPSPSRSLSRSRSGGSKRRVASSSSKGRRHRKSNSKDDCTIQQKSQPKQQQQLPKPKPTTTNEAHQKKQQGGDDISTPATAGTSSKSAKTTSKKLGKKSVWTSLLSQFKHDLTSAASPRSEFCKHDPCRWNAV